MSDLEAKEKEKEKMERSNGNGDVKDKHAVKAAHGNQNSIQMLAAKSISVYDAEDAEMNQLAQLLNEDEQS